MDKILGFEKLSLVDYDGYVACTIFMGNCNFRCPFCHNSSLVLEYNDLQSLDKNEILKYLESKKKMIDAVYAFIRDYNAKNQQFNVILKKSFSESPVLYMDDNMDITREIIDGLNEEYRNVKGK